MFLSSKSKNRKKSQHHLQPSLSTIVVYDGSKSFWKDKKVTGFRVARGRDHYRCELIINSFDGCVKLASLGVMREGRHGHRDVGLLPLPSPHFAQGTARERHDDRVLRLRLHGPHFSRRAASHDDNHRRQRLLQLRRPSPRSAPGFSPDCDVHYLVLRLHQLPPRSSPPLKPRASPPPSSGASTTGSSSAAASPSSPPCARSAAPTSERARLSSRRSSLLCDDLVREIVEFVGACE